MAPNGVAGVRGEQGMGCPCEVCGLYKRVYAHLSAKAGSFLPHAVPHHSPSAWARVDPNTEFPALMLTPALLLTHRPA